MLHDWILPIQHKLIGATSNSMSFQNINIASSVEIPIGEHCGAFGVRRRFDHHKGVDLYCPEKTPVFPVEPGLIIRIRPWTGEKAGCPWWLETDAIFIQGRSGNIAYGEIEVNPECHIGDTVNTNVCLGWTKKVLKQDKGRPTCMLHLQIYRWGCMKIGMWKLDTSQPEALRDPTIHLLNCKERLS